MASLSRRRAAAPLLVRLALVAGLVAANAAIGLQWQRLPLAVLLALAGGAGLAVLALLDMPLALTLFVLAAGVVSFSLSTGTMSSLNVAMLMLGLFAGVWLVRVLTTRRFSLAATPLNRPLLLFLAAALASLIYGLLLAGEPGALRIASLKVQLGQYAIFVLIVASFLLGANHPAHERTLRLWTVFLILSGVVMMVIGVISGHYYVLPYWSGSLYMWPIVLLCGQILYNARIGLQLRLLGLGGIGLWALWVWRAAIGYKSIFAPAAVAMAILLFLRSKRLFALAVAGAFIVASLYGPARINDVLMRGEYYSATPIRANLWLDVFRLGARSPVLGLGPANYTYYWSDTTFQSRSYQHVSRYAWTREVYAPPAHNVFADMFAQNGAVGLLLFCWALAGGLRLGRQAVRRPLTPFARAYGYAVLAGFSAQILASFLFAEWLLPFVYNIGFGNFPQAAYTWLLLGTLAWLGGEEQARPQEKAGAG